MLQVTSYSGLQSTHVAKDHQNVCVLSLFVDNCMQEMNNFDNHDCCIVHMLKHFLCKIVIS